MPKIIIADDEKIIRAGMRKIISAELGEGATLFEAHNGIEALDLCVREKADVLITDIRMPNMDGVELMRQISTLSQKPHIIVLSGYEDFSYAKAAIASGAEAYILKPIDKAEFIGAIKNALTQVAERERSKNDSALKKIVLESDDSAASELDATFFSEGVVCVAASGIEAAQTLCTVAEGSPYSVIERRKDYLCLAVHKDFLEAISLSQNCATLSIGVSTSATSYRDVRRLREEAATALLQSFFATTDGIRRPGLYTFLTETSEAHFAIVDSSYEKLVSYIELADVSLCQRQLKELFSFGGIPAKTRAAALRYLYRRITGNLFHRFPAQAMGDDYLHAKELMVENLAQADSLSEWQHYVTDYVVYLIALMQKRNGAPAYITQALAYLRTHFTDPDLTMTMVSNQVSVNYTWFSEKFKEYTGQGFNDYVQCLRLAHAKHLLEQGQYRVYEVAARSGYRDVKHFMKLFRKETGVRPSEWARINASAEN